jgi:acid stress-induced BolA-like protein IbaG/YrbA
VKKPKYIERLEKALKTQLAAEVEVEQSAPHRYRFAVVSKKFERMRPLKRQDLIWKIVDETLDREQVLAISMILAFAPKDVARV